MLLGTFLALFFCQLSPAQNPEADALQSTQLTQQGDEALKQKQNQEAIDLYTKATELNTKNGLAWTRLGRLTYALGDRDKGKSFLREGWACGEPSALRTLGGLALLEGNFPAFEELLPDLIKLKDSSVDVRTMIVLYYKKVGKMNSDNLDPVLQGVDLSKLAMVSRENLLLLQQGYEALGRSLEVAAIEAELKKRETVP
jgi:tetratricopeptide (TPR) repeat protein